MTPPDFDDAMLRAVGYRPDSDAEVCHIEGRIDGVLHICNRPRGHKSPCVLDLYKQATAREPPDSDAREVRLCETCGAAYQIYPGPVRRFAIIEPPLAQRILAALEGRGAMDERYALADELRERMPR